MNPHCGRLILPRCEWCGFHRCFVTAPPSFVYFQSMISWFVEHATQPKSSLIDDQQKWHWRLKVISDHKPLWIILVEHWSAMVIVLMCLCVLHIRLTYWKCKGWKTRSLRQPLVQVLFPNLNLNHSTRRSPSTVPGKLLWFGYSVDYRPHACAPKELTRRLTEHVAVLETSTELVASTKDDYQRLWNFKVHFGLRLWRKPTLGRERRIWRRRV